LEYQLLSTSCDYYQQSFFEKRNAGRQVKHHLCKNRASEDAVALQTSSVALDFVGSPCYISASGSVSHGRRF
jgi:hypothetical protein